MISSFKIQKVVENRLKFLPAVIKKDPENDNFYIKSLNKLEEVKVRTYREMENEPASYVTETRVINNAGNTERYTTSCYFHQVRSPVWYSETLLVDLEEKTQTTNEKIFYDNQIRPDHWAESYETDIVPKENDKVVCRSEIIIKIEEEPGTHYISLERQQEPKPE